MKLTVSNRIRSLMLAGAAWLMLGAPALSQTSVYTTLSGPDGGLLNCETLSAAKADGEGEWAYLRCPGVGGVDLYIDYADARDTIRVGKDGKGTPFLPPFTGLGAKAEWRMAGGKPYAMIVRLTLGGIEEYKGQWLTVHHVNATTGQGCLVGYVDARANKNANVLARELADTVGREGCRTNGPAISGKMGNAMRELIAQKPQG
ncbi:MAG: hypothetical protein AAGK33_01255 [Pseudomonadota bacterium]